MAVADSANAGWYNLAIFKKDIIADEAIFLCYFLPVCQGYAWPAASSALSLIT